MSPGSGGGWEEFAGLFYHQISEGMQSLKQMPPPSKRSVCVVIEVRFGPLPARGW